MCLPPLILAAVALEAAGSGMQYFGQKKADNAVWSAFNKEHQRQQDFEAQQQADFQKGLDSTQQNLLDPNAVAAATARRDAALTSATLPTGPATQSGYMPGSSSANQVVHTDAAKKGKMVDGRTANMAAAMAALGGMSDLFQKNDINIAHNGQDIGQIGSFMRGSMDALQPEMDAAKLKGGTLRQLGGLAQTIGNAMMMAGGGGGPNLNMTVGNIDPGSLFKSASMTDAFNSLPGMAI